MPKVKGAGNRVAPPAAAPKLKLVGVLGGTFAVLLAAMVGEDTLKLKDWLIAEALRVIGGVAATAGADGVKLKVLGELAPAASLGLPFL